MVNRRAFIKQCIALYGSLLLMPACKNEIERQQCRCFSVEESECLGAICEQFIPADDFPGAKEAGVVNFIDKLLYQRFPELQPDYKNGIQALEKFCSETFRKSFANLSWEQQYSILQQMERNELPETYWKDVSQRSFFNMVLRNTMQGYYGPPRHGGNKDYVSYRMMRLDYPLLIGQNRYE
ncbi:gluconate 2-dehydrogenase subunit 3 family protein [uncultured Parabacteroides sp.]|uniref:gluconate 2-dehydrogenase subunit 3 family protein n=1 Tax=uncultured Parabacteroides sp. TaxID=512312 RepID=UPI0025D86CE9|nr:gluconate 2-dehydrogenase subunit 3 family protein [uncultured Parabacteroides sp.]